MTKLKSNDIITDEQIIISKIKEARLAYDNLKHAIRIIDMLDDGELNDQLNSWYCSKIGDDTLSNRLIRFINRMHEVKGIKVKGVKYGK